MSKAHDEQRDIDVDTLRTLADKQGGQSRIAAFHAAADALADSPMKLAKNDRSVSAAIPSPEIKDLDDDGE